MKRAGILVAIAAVAISALLLLSLPARRSTLPPTADGTIVGAVHIHTTRSDGRYAPDQIAAIAARLGLKFLVFTDHGDGTRVPDPPAYRSGVLCLDGVEVSTAGGHYIALGMPAAPYPLAGEPRDVVEDVRRLGGFGIAAHPGSPKPELRWQDWAAPIDAVEWVNPDTSWRVYAAGPWTARLKLIVSLFYYPIRPAETVASLLTEPDQTMTQWNALATRRAVVGMAGLDAHAKLAFKNVGPGDNFGTAPVPSYEASFGALSVHVALDQPFGGSAQPDAAALMRAIRAGHLYAAVDGLASPPALDFTATNANGTAHEGDELGVGGAVTLHVRSNAPDGFTTILWRNRQMLATERRNEFTIQSGPNPAVYRVEIRSSAATHQLSWLYSNPVYVRAPEAVRPVPSDPPSQTQTVFDSQMRTGWHVEEDGISMVAVSEDGEGELQIAYTLAPGGAVGQRATLVWPATVGEFRRLRLTARADAPMRLSVQVRTADGGQSPRRWRRSIYLDQEERTVGVDFGDMQPTPENPTPRPPLDKVNDILLVVDTTNAKPGTTGRMWIRRLALER